MHGTEFLFKENDRVRLRDEVDPSFYAGLAKVGNEGWVREMRRDHLGLPEVYIEWDRNHWAYNRQPDRWTYQEHFDLVRRESVSSSDKGEAARQLAAEFGNQLAALLGGEETPAPEASSDSSPGPESVVSPPSSEEAAHYAEVLAAAREALEEPSEGFILITVRRGVDERAPQGILGADVVGQCTSPESESLIGAHLSTLGAQFHKAAALELVHHYADERDAKENGSPAS